MLMKNKYELDVTIVMINYNTYKLSKDSIDSIIKYTSGLSYELYLVDNASSDGSGKKLQEEYKDNKNIVFMMNDKNFGTSKAFNKAARLGKGKYTLWINSDILLKDNFIKTLFDFMESNPKAGVVGGNLLNFEGKPADSVFFSKKKPLSRIKSEGSFFYLLKRKIIKKNLHFNYSGKIKEVADVIGADMFVRSSVFDEIGYLDEDIFMYGEDNEFQYRVLHKTNYKIYSNPNAVMYHLEGASSKNKDNSFNPTKCRFMNEGVSIWILKSSGKNSQEKYFNLKEKQYKKYRLAAKLLGKKNKAEEYSKKLEIIKDLQKKFGF